MGVVYDIYGIFHEARPRARASRENGPTRHILDMARAAPGGVIRWREANAAYLTGSANARRSRSKNYHMGIKRILDRHFTKVEGIDGHYILSETIVGED